MKLKGAFSFLQTIGQSLMLPVAVLPVAGLLLGIGAANFTWLSPVVSALMKDSGNVVFANMGLLFAIAVALGFTRNDGASAVAAIVGYAVMLATLGVMAGVWHVKPVAVMGIPTMQMGVFGGILAGALAAVLFNRFSKIVLPPWLGFFAGRRFVPIVTALAAIVLGVALSVVWPPVQSGINAFSHWAAEEDPRLAATVYGFVERLLVPFGLHHIWNAPFFYEIGSWPGPNGGQVHGDIQRYFSGDPTAGILSGAFLFKMFGLPAAAIAIWRSAKPKNRTAVAGVMISAALTSFATGITEPIEFTFLFVAPELYLLHALLAASAQFLMATLGAHMGFTFSQGGIDFLLFNVLNPFSQKWWLVLILGPAYAAVYYVTFAAVIRWRNLKTPGREDEPAVAEVAGAPLADPKQEQARRLLAALGGRANLKSFDACITRLRVKVDDPKKVDERALKALGATGVMLVGDGVQAVFGARSETLKADLDEYLKTTEHEAPMPILPSPRTRGEGQGEGLARDQAGPLLSALGGHANVRTLEAIALTRLRVELLDAAKFDEAAARRAGVLAVMRVAPGVLHLVVGDRAPQVAQALRAA